MKKSCLLNKKPLIYLVTLLTVLAVIYFRPIIIEQYLWLKSHLLIPNYADKSLGLNAYQADIQAKKLAGISDDISGLTYNVETATLFAVTNDPSQVVEISKEGNVLRIIPVAGLVDVEGISHIRHNKYVITEESTHKIYEVKINQNTTKIDQDGLRQIKLGVAGKLIKNKGLEGVEWDQSRETLFVVKEKHPMKVYEIKGFPPKKSNLFDISIDEWEPKQAKLTHLTDLSSIFIHQPTGNVILLGEESKLLVEYEYDGAMLSMMKLKSGYHNLTHDVPQAEGLAIDTDNFIYIVSEPNLFYRFSKASK